MREYEVYDPYSKLNVDFVYRRDRREIDHLPFLNSSLCAFKGHQVLLTAVPYTG